MKSVYSINSKEMKEGSVAFLTNSSFRDDAILNDYIEKNKSFPDEMILRNYVIKKTGIEFGDISDNTVWNPILNTELAISLFSQELKDCIDSCRKTKDDFIWLPIKVSDAKETRTYYTLYFNNIPDVLDKKNTTRVKKDLILKPCFALEKCTDYSIFTIGRGNWKCPFDLCITEEVKKKIKEKGFKGIYFESSLCSEKGCIFKN